MKIIIFRFVCSILILCICTILIVYSSKKDTYTIKYNTYQYNPDNNKQELKDQNCKFVLTGYSKHDVSNKLIDIEYLNNLCIGDSISIISIDKF